MPRTTGIRPTWTRTHGYFAAWRRLPRTTTLSHSLRQALCKSRTGPCAWTRPTRLTSWKRTSRSARHRLLLAGRAEHRERLDPHRPRRAHRFPQASVLLFPQAAATETGMTHNNTQYSPILQNFLRNCAVTNNTTLDANHASSRAFIGAKSTEDSETHQKLFQ